MANEKMTEVVGIEELIQDDHNMNKGTEAGIKRVRVIETDGSELIAA